jgi:hypothetical protein
MENYIYSMLNHQRIREDLDDEDFISRLNYSLRDSQEYKEFTRKQQQKPLAHFPVFQDFISTQQVKGDANIAL